MGSTRRRRDAGRRRPSVLDIAPAVALFTVMAVPWLTTQAYQAQDAQIVPFELAADDAHKDDIGILRNDRRSDPR